MGAAQRHASWSAWRAITIVIELIAALVFTALAPHASACTVFAVPSDETVCGANLDWPDDLEGYVLVNPRGIEKTFVPWSGFEPSEHNGAPVSWTSKYASITLTCFGRDFIEGGMNERGLIVEQANLPSVYPPDDGRPGVSAQQWMQYVLDSYRSVGEVVDNIESVRQDGEGWHYLVVDRSGDWAAIEFLHGEPVVYRAGRHEFPVITNATYGRTEAHVPLDVRFGGEVDVGAGSDSYSRFVRVAERLRDRRGAWLGYAPDAPADTTGARERWNALDNVDFAFALLDNISADDTQRSVVYDTGALRVYWKSWRNPEVRYISLTSLGRREGSCVRAIPLHAPLAGDATGVLDPLSDRQNQELLEHVRRLIGGADAGEQNAD